MKPGWEGNLFECRCVYIMQMKTFQLYKWSNNIGQVFLEFQSCTQFVPFFTVSRSLTLPATIHTIAVYNVICRPLNVAVCTPTNRLLCHNFTKEKVLEKGNLKCRLSCSLCLREESAINICLSLLWKKVGGEKFLIFSQAFSLFTQRCQTFLLPSKALSRSWMCSIFDYHSWWHSEKIFAFLQLEVVWRTSRPKALNFNWWLLPRKDLLGNWYFFNKT